MRTETAVLAGGCFWCTEAVYQSLEGVQSVTPGYAGGHTANPSYEAVCSGRTGHAEGIKIVFDPDTISYHTLLTVFFGTHDPTTLNRQGNDIGTQYRSMILYTSPEQKQIAQDFIKEAQSVVVDPIVTEIQPLEKFYDAEDYHKNYYARNVLQPYCQLVINPKLTKLKEKFHHLLKS